MSRGISFTSDANPPETPICAVTAWGSALKIRHVEWLAFRVPFVTPFAAAHGTIGVREGLLLRVTTHEGPRGLGEASPLPSFGGGDLASAISRVREMAQFLIGRDVCAASEALGEVDIAAPGAAVAACGVDTALCDLQAQAADTSVARLLDAKAAATVPVNAIIGVAGKAEAARRGAAAVAAGFTCVKLKVGMARTVEDEVERIRLVRQALGPGVRLRLDANGAWDVATAIAVLRASEDQDIELVEQPVAAADVTGMAQVRSCVALPIAADEAATDAESARRVIAAGAADLLVIKPMIAGGLRQGHEMIRLAREAGLGAIVTTTLDAGVGVAAALHLAATLPMPMRHCGLATGSLLASSLLARPFSVVDGYMALPQGPGLGVTLDEKQLARYGDGWHEATP